MDIKVREILSYFFDLTISRSRAIFCEDGSDQCCAEIKKLLQQRLPMRCKNCTKFGPCCHYTVGRYFVNLIDFAKTHTDIFRNPAYSPCGGSCVYCYHTVYFYTLMCNSYAEAKLLYDIGLVCDKLLSQVREERNTEMTLSRPQDPRMATFLTRILDQPRSLLNLSMTHVSGRIGWPKDREQRVRSLGLPRKVEDLLNWKRQSAEYLETIASDIEPV